MDFDESKEIKFENNPTRSEERDKLRKLLAERTEDFVAAGGKVQEVGHQMREPPKKFIVSPTKVTPLDRLLGKPKATRTQAMPKPLTAQAKPKRPQPTQVLPAEQLAARLMAQAALGASPSAAAKAIGITEKHARQIARDFNITFTRQR